MKYGPPTPLALKQNILIWGSLILTGILAYGVGLYQGSHYRIERSVAAITTPTPAPLTNSETPENK